MKKIAGDDINNSLTYRNMFGVSLFGSRQEVLLNMVEDNWGKQFQWIATVNPEFLMNGLKDRQFLNILQNRTSINVIDGVGIIWGMNVKSQKLKVKKLIWGVKMGVEILAGKHREAIITGADLMDKFCEVASKKKRTVYFFGGWGERAKKTAEYFEKKYPKLKVVGARAEDFDFKTKVDYLFVARGMKKQEEWIDKNLEKLKVNLVMGVGRSFDYYSGELKRAPSWMRKMGLEWLFSLMMEPRRWKRQLELPKFVLKILLQE